MKTRQVLLCTVMLALSGAPVFGQSVRIEGEGGAAALLGLAKQDFERIKSTSTRLDVASSSTASAIAKLCRGEIGIAGVVRVMTKAEGEACSQNHIQVFELLIANNAIVIVANPDNTWAREISLEELRRAWVETAAKAVSWKQVNSTWPDVPLKLYGPGPKMGVSTALRTALRNSSGVPDLRRDMTSTDVFSVVVEAVARDRAALGILDWASYANNAKRVRLVAVAGQGRPAADRSGGALSFPIYLYASNSALEDAETKGYVDHLLANASRFVTEVGLVPLSASNYQEARTRISTKR